MILMISYDIVKSFCLTIVVRAVNNMYINKFYVVPKFERKTVFEIFSSYSWIRKVSIAYINAVVVPLYI